MTKHLIKYPTTPHYLHYTILWNVAFKNRSDP